MPQNKRPAERPPDTRKHTVLPVSIRLKSTEKTPACVSMWAFLQPISARIYFGKTASHRKSARFVQSRGAPPQAYWMSVKVAQQRGCAKRAFCGVCFLMSDGLKPEVLFCCRKRRGLQRPVMAVMTSNSSGSSVLVIASPSSMSTLTICSPLVQTMRLVLPSASSCTAS